MSNSRKIYYFAFILAILTNGNLSAQVKRVLVIPFDQFQFESPTPLEEIAEFNGWKDPTVIYVEYNKAIVNFLNEAEDSVVFFPVIPADLEQIRNLIPRIYKREPVSHYGVDIEPIKQNEMLQNLLNQMGADYILFINRYKIIGKLIAARANIATAGKFVNWSSHLIDYEIYDAKANLVCGADRFTFNPHNPNSKTYQTKGTLVTDLERPSLKLAADIAYKIDRYEKKGKVIFKHKVK